MSDPNEPRPYGDWMINNEPPPESIIDFVARVWGCDTSQLNAADQGRLAAICGGRLPRKYSDRTGPNMVAGAAGFR